MKLKTILLSSILLNSLFGDTYDQTTTPQTQTDSPKLCGSISFPSNSFGFSSSPFGDCNSPTPSPSPSPTPTPTPTSSGSIYTPSTVTINKTNSNEVEFNQDIIKTITEESTNQKIETKDVSLSDGVKSNITMDVPKENSNINLKASVNLTDGTKTSFEAESKVKVTITTNGGINSKVSNNEVEAEVNINANSEGSTKIIVQKKVEVTMKTPKNSEIKQDNTGRVTSKSKIDADTGEKNLKPIEVEMSAEVSGNLKTTANITNGSGQTQTFSLELPAKVESGQMELMKSNSANAYSGIKSNFKTSTSFKITDKSKRAVIEGENIKIVGTTAWQKFEEKQYFDGNRTIKLLLGGANVIKDGVTEELIKDVEYELPPSFGNSSTNQNLSPIYSDNYLKLTKGWSLISTPINSEIDIKKSFNTCHIPCYNITNILPPETGNYYKELLKKGRLTDAIISSNS